MNEMMIWSFQFIVRESDYINELLKLPILEDAYYDLCFLFNIDEHRELHIRPEQYLDVFITGLSAHRRLTKDVACLVNCHPIRKLII